MIRHTETTRPRPVEDRPGLILAGVPVTPIGMVVGAAALRGVAVAMAGLAALAGLAVLIWAFTPASGSDASAALRAGVAAFAAANLMPVSIAGIALTLSPLLFTSLLVALLATTAQRGRFQPEGRYQETLAIGTTAVVYGLVVAATVRGFGPPEAISPTYVWTAPVLALGAVTVGTLLRPSGWRTWWLLITPPWVRRGVRAGGVAAATLVAGGALVLCLALLVDFGSAVGISALAAPTWADGLGLTMVGAAYVPNAVVAAVGYVAGVGFEVGPATFSPLGSTSAELAGDPAARREYPRRPVRPCCRSACSRSRCSPARSPVGFSSAARSASPDERGPRVSQPHSPARRSACSGTSRPGASGTAGGRISERRRCSSPESSRPRCS